MSSVAPEERNRGAKRALVLDEAARALNHRGVSQTSLADIAQRLGVSRVSLYHYFDDQEDLVFQCYRRSCELMARRFNDASQRFSTALDVIDAFIEGMIGEDEPEFAALSEVAFLRPDQRSTILGLYQGLRANLADTIDDGIKRGELRNCQSKLVAPAIISMVSWVFWIRGLRVSEQLSQRDFIQAVKDLLRHGVAADRALAPNYLPIPLSGLDWPAGRVFDPEAMAAARQEALLAAASWLFNLKGIDATPLEEIALRVGVTKKVIYHNMGDKQALVVLCHRRAFRIYEDIVARMRAHPGSRIDAISACIHALSEAAVREDIAPLPLTTGDETIPSDVRDELQASMGRLVNVYLETYAKGWAEGSVRSLNPRAAINMIPAICDWLPKWFDALEASERAAAPHELALLYRLGLQAVE